MVFDLRGVAMTHVHFPSRSAVRAAITASLQHDGASLLCAARQLRLSTRSLQRHLGELGTSYSEMVAEVRLDTARHLLADTDDPIAVIALRLDYAGTSGFSRAFMRLTKTPPASYRRQCRIAGVLPRPGR